MDHSNILNFVRTTSEQEELKDIATSLLGNIYKKSFDYRKASINPYQKFIASKIIQDLESQKITTDKTKTEKYLKALIDDSNKLSTIKITIAIQPTAKLLEKLGYWTPKNTKSKTIFDIKVDPKILGGAIISDKKGVYRDFSLLKKIDNTFQTQNKEIQALL